LGDQKRITTVLPWWSWASTARSRGADVARVEAFGAAGLLLALGAAGLVALLEVVGALAWALDGLVAEAAGAGVAGEPVLAPWEDCEEEELGEVELEGVDLVEDAWLDFSCSCLAFCCEVVTAPWALAIALVRPATPGAVGPGAAEPGWGLALAEEGLGEALVDVVTLGADGEAPDPLGFEECPCSSSSQTAASRATAARPIW
jgi:hypothetical protein